MNTDANMIKSKTNWMEIYQKDVGQLKKSGKDWVGFCPFHHNVNTPSFVIFPDGGWRCFGACGEGGDIISFVMKKENLDFARALVFLAEKAGIDIQDDRKTSYADFQKWLTLYECVWQYFQDRRGSEGGKLADNYLRTRFGVSVIQKLGYAPVDGLFKYLTSQKIDRDFILESGLVWIDQNGQGRDFFRDRIMIPIKDINQNIIAFAGRVVGNCPPGVPKFINSPNTPVFIKSSTWFGLQHNWSTYFKHLVVVEGYFDVLVAQAAAQFNVISPMGTSISENQMHQLSKMTGRVVLALDPDNAGQKAVERGIKAAEKIQEVQVGTDWRGLFQMQSRNKLDIYVAEMPEGKDPDQVILEHGTKGWKELIDHAIPAPEYLIQHAIAGQDLSDLAVKKQVIQAVMPTLAGIGDDITRDYYMQRLTDLTGVDGGILKKMLSNKELPVIKDTRDHFGEIEKRILSLLLSDTQALAWVNRNLFLARMGEFTPADFENSECHQIAEVYWQGLDQIETDSLDFVGIYVPPPLQELLGELRASKLDLSREQIVGEVLRNLLILRQERGKQKLNYLVSLQKQGETEAAKEILSLNQVRGRIEKALRYLLDFRKKNNLEILDDEKE